RGALDGEAGRGRADQWRAAGRADPCRLCEANRGGDAVRQLQAELLERDRTGEEIPLGALASEPPQELRLLQGFHAFRHDVDPQALSQHEDALDDLDLALVVSHGADEGTVDLERVDGQLVQVAERRIPGSEVI